MPKPVPPPRMYAIVAAAAPRALVFRRGPSTWFHLAVWHTDTGVVESGAWFKKKLFPRRCDLSSDGRLMLFYLAGGFESQYRVFAGISRTPWLHPLESWDERDTWGRGWYFEDSNQQYGWGPVNKLVCCGRSINIQRNDAVSFVNERRRGWSEGPGCPPKCDPWDEHRKVLLQKHQPNSSVLLHLVDDGHSSEGIDGHVPRFHLSATFDGSKLLEDAVWADWDHAGRLLIITSQGCLQVAKITAEGLEVVHSHDLSALTPDPQAPPDWAKVI